MTLHPKVAAATAGGVVAGAVSDLIVTALQAHGANLAPNVVGDINVLVIGTFTFLAGWLTPSPVAETPKT